MLTGSEVKSLRQGRASRRRGLRAHPGRRGSGSSRCTSRRTSRARSAATTRSARGSSCCTARRSSGSSSRQKEQSLALVPMRVYFSHGLAKVELGLGTRQARAREAAVDVEAAGRAGDGARRRPPALVPQALSRRLPYTRIDNCIWGCTGFDLDVHRLGEAGRDPGCLVKRRINTSADDYALAA